MNQSGSEFYPIISSIQKMALYETKSVIYPDETVHIHFINIVPNIFYRNII